MVPANLDKPPGKIFLQQLLKSRLPCQRSSEMKHISNKNTPKKSPHNSKEILFAVNSLTIISTHVWNCKTVSKQANIYSNDGNHNSAKYIPFVTAVCISLILVKLHHLYLLPGVAGPK